MFIDGTEFEEYIIKSVLMDLETCQITFTVIFHKDKLRMVKLRDYTFETDCNVDVSEYIKRLELQLNGSSIL